MSRPASCNGVSGTTPLTASVVDFWKNRGTISTRPPTATTSRISTIIRKLLVSTFSWEKPVAGVALSLMLNSFCGSGVGDGDGRDGDAHGAPHQALHHAGDPHGGDVQHDADGGRPEVDLDRLDRIHLLLAEQARDQVVQRT